MKKSEWLAGMGLLGACALCCALPLIGGVAALGISSFFMNPIFVLSVAIVFVVVGTIVYQRRKANGSPCVKKSCNCNSCSSERGKV